MSPGIIRSNGLRSHDAVFGTMTRFVVHQLDMDFIDFIDGVGDEDGDRTLCPMFDEKQGT